MVKRAIAIFNRSLGNIIDGFVIFNQNSPSEDVLVEINLFGPVPNGLHGIHIHTNSAECLGTMALSDCCDTLGKHFVADPRGPWSLDNPDGIKHGSLLTTERHNGDMINNVKFMNGNAYHIYRDDMISLYKNDNRCVIGRSVVIHDKPDNCGLYNREIINKENLIETYITGCAGDRIDCSTIIEI